MTGDDFTSGLIIFLIAVLAVFIPALIATLIRRYFADPVQEPNVIANIIISPLVYVVGFIVAWGLMIFVLWDGSKPIEHLIISPFSYVVLPSIYAALIGLMTALLSFKLPRNVKLAKDHVIICICGHLIMAIVMFFASTEYEQYIAQEETSSTDAYVPNQASPTAGESSTVKGRSDEEWRRLISEAVMENSGGTSYTPFVYYLPYGEPHEFDSNYSKMMDKVSVDVSRGHCSWKPSCLRFTARIKHGRHGS